MIDFSTRLSIAKISSRPLPRLMASFVAAYDLSAKYIRTENIPPRLKL